MTEGEVVICRRCGFGNVPGDQFCGSCGAFLEWEGQPSADTTEAAADSPTAVWPTVATSGTGPADAPAPSGAASWQDAQTTVTPIPAAPVAAAPVPPAPASPAEADLVRCPACGTANPGTRTFCQSCGATLAAASRIVEPSAEAIAAAVAAVPAARTSAVPPGTARTAARAQAPRSRGIPGWLIGMVALGVLVGVVAVGASVLLRGQGPATEASEAPVSALPSASASGSGGPGASGEATGSAAPGVTARLTLTGAAASSVLGNKAAYQAAMAIDGNLKTAWQEGSKTEKGQWVEVSFASARADSVVIFNGYQASTALYRGNLRLKDVLISVNGGSAIKAQLADTTKAQTIDLGGVSGATTVRITIVSTYKASRTSVAGTPFDDAAVSEIQVNGVAGG